jgi:DNA-binding transcriptional MerR regulator
MAKAKDAFRTISEVAEWMDTPTHVLRFWETKFSQIRPVKGAGGRRYYRPSDMELLGGIKQLLHEDGLTIKGVQKILREKGAKHVATLSPRVAVADAQDIPAAPDPAAAPEPVVAQDVPQSPEPVAAPPEPIAPAVAEVAPEPEPEPEPVTPPARFAPAPQAASPVQARLPLDDLVMPARSDPPRKLPEPPADPQDLTPQAEQISPLLNRLQALRDRMRDG